MLRVLYGTLLLVCIANAASTVDKSSAEKEEVEIAKIPEVEIAKIPEDSKVSSLEVLEDDVVEENSVAPVLDEEILQDEAQDRFVDLSVDVSYGLPQLGYVYNGLHLRGPRTGKGGNYVVHGVPHGATGRQTFQTNFDFDSDFQDIRQNFKRDPTNIEVMVEETGNPGAVNYVTPPSEPAVAEEYVAEPVYPTAANFPSNADQFNYPPYTAPGSAASPTEDSSTFYIGATKPPLHIKIKQDLEGLMGSMKNILVGTKKQGSTLGLNLPPLIVPKQSSTPFKLQMPALPTLPQAPGKPPLMEKIRQDFFSWLPTSNEVNPSGSYGAPEATYDAPAPAYETPAAYEAPAPAYVSPVYDAPEEPEPYQPPTYPKQGTVEREPMLSKFVKDLTKVNKWLARQTLDMVNEGQSLQLPFELPELPALPKIKKRQDHKVMKYMNAPDLSNRDSEQ